MKKKLLSLFSFVLVCAVLVWGFTTISQRDDKGNRQDNSPISKDKKLIKDQQKYRDAGIQLPANDNINPNPHAPQSVISESFEGTFLPTGWSKANPDGGTGWNQQTAGTTPMPGWNGGTITTPPGGGSKVAYVTWNTGGPSSNDQYLITPQITNVQSNDSLKFWLRYWPNSYRDSIEVLISTTTPTPAAFTTLVFRKNFETVTGDTTWQEYKFRIGNLVSSGANIYIAFREVVADNLTDGASFSLDLVSTTGIGLTNDIATTGNVGPSGTLLLPGNTIAPKATFQNVGSANQTNIPVSYTISGPVNYSSNKTIAALNAGASTSVTFDSTFVPTPGSYNVTIYCSLGSDQNRSNDTIKTTFTAINPNSGSGAGYFFANSVSSGVKPSYCWADTTGSTSLIVNQVVASPLNLTGNIDDGYFKILLPGGKKVRFFGTNFDTIRIGTNGIIGFQEFTPGGGNWNPPSAGIPGGTVLNAYYPFWKDFDFSDNSITTTNRLSYKVVGNQLVITYDRAPVYFGNVGEYVSFQTIMDISASPVSNSRILTQFADSSSSMTGGAFIQALNANTITTHLIGLQDGSGSNGLTYRFRNASSVVTPGPMFTGTNSALAVQFGPNAADLNYTCKNLALTFRLEAIQLTRRDTVTVTLRESASPYAIVESKKVVSDSVSGLVNVSFALAENGSSYFIVATHRNSITTWSAAGVPCAANAMTYNFTSNICQAYLCNQALVNALTDGALVASYYSGDVTRDGCVDLSDIVAIFNDAGLFVGGPYVLTDLNFDEFVDLTDIVYAFNNSSLFVCEQAPPGPRNNPKTINTDVKVNNGTEVVNQTIAK